MDDAGDSTGIDRRTYLARVGAATAVAATAGCGVPGGEDEEEDGGDEDGGEEGGEGGEGGEDEDESLAGPDERRP